MRSRVRFPVLPRGFFLEGEDPHGDHGLGSLVEFRFKAPPGRVKTECNGTRAESRFGLPAKRTSPFMLLVVFMLDSDYSPSSVTTNNINGLVRFAGRPNLLSARVPLHSVRTLLPSVVGHAQNLYFK